MINYPCVEAITWCLGPNLTLCGHDMQRSAGPNPQALFSFVWKTLGLYYTIRRMSSVKTQYIVCFLVV